MGHPEQKLIQDRSETAATRQRYDASHTALFDVRISDLLCLDVFGIARPIAEKASSLEDARQIRDMRDVVDVGHLPALLGDR